MKKKFYQKKWFVIVMAVLVIGIIGGALGSNEDEKQQETQGQYIDNNMAESNTEQSTELSSEMFVEDVKTAIRDATGENEKIVDVIFENGDLCVYVDFSEVDPSPLTLEELAISRTSSITDNILELTQYESQWNTVTVDFGSLGHIRNDKKNMENSENGIYFQTENFKLE